MLKKITEILFPIIFILSSIAAIAQTKDSVCFTKDQVLKIANTVKTLQTKDSLQNQLITNLKTQISDYKSLQIHDSTIVSYKDQEINILTQKVNLYSDIAKKEKPTFFDSKVMWFVFGAGTIILSSYVVANIK